MNPVALRRSRPSRIFAIRTILRELADNLEADEEFDTQTAGFTKCYFPVLTKRYVVRDGEVLHADLSSLEPIDE